MSEVTAVATTPATAVTNLGARSAVYIVRPGENEELRYSLRSLAANVPHRDVWIVGSAPEWVRGVNRLMLEPQDEKWANIRQSLNAACLDDRISEDFILWNDDMFALSPLDRLPVLHLGRQDEYLESLRERGYDPAHPWFRAVCEAHDQLLEWGYRDALSYESHLPMPFNRRELAEILRSPRHPLSWGSFYSATSGPTGRAGENVKVAGFDSRELMLRLIHGHQFISTTEQSFADGKVGEFIRDTFPNPGPYEEASCRCR